jgi:hypothetical protein
MRNRVYLNRGSRDLDGNRLVVARPNVTKNAALLRVEGEPNYSWTGTVDVVLDRAQVHDLMDQLQALVSPQSARYVNPAKPAPTTEQRTITRPRTVTQRRLVIIPNATLVQEAPEQRSYIGGSDLVVGLADDKGLRLSWIWGGRARTRLAEDPPMFEGVVFTGRNAFATTLPSVLRAYADLVEQPTTTRTITETVTETVTIPAPTTPGVSGEDFRS